MLVPNYVVVARSVCDFCKNLAVSLLTMISKQLGKIIVELHKSFSQRKNLMSYEEFCKTDLIFLQLVQQPRTQGPGPWGPRGAREFFDRDGSSKCLHKKQMVMRKSFLSVNINWLHDKK